MNKLRTKGNQEDAQLICTECKTNNGTASSFITRRSNAILESVYNGIENVPSLNQQEWDLQLNQDIGDQHRSALLDSSISSAQLHMHVHTSSCFKGSKRLCRYKLPQIAVASTTLTSSAGYGLNVALPHTGDENSFVYDHHDSKSFFDDESEEGVVSGWRMNVRDVAEYDYAGLFQYESEGDDDVKDGSPNVDFKSRVESAYSSEFDYGSAAWYDSSEHSESSGDAMIENTDMQISNLLSTCLDLDGGASSSSTDVKMSANNDYEYASMFSAVFDTDSDELSQMSDEEKVELAALLDNADSELESHPELIDDVLEVFMTEAELPSFYQSSSASAHIDVHLARNVTDSFVSPYNPSVSKIFSPCNTNVFPVHSYLLANYMAAYQSKHNVELRKVQTYVASRVVKYLQRRRSQGVASNSLGALCSALDAAGSLETIGSQMAAFLLLQGSETPSRFLYSHSFSSIQLKQARNELEGEEIRVSADRHGNIKTPLSDYLNRPTLLSPISLFEYRSEFEVLPRSRAGSKAVELQVLDEAKDTENYYILNGHLEGSTQKIVRRRKSYAVPLVYGRRIPDWNSLHYEDDSVIESMNEEETRLLLSRRERYGSIVCPLFVPFFSVDDLKVDSEESWWHAFKRHQGIIFSCPSALRYLHAQQMYYAAFMRAGSAGEDNDEIDAIELENRLADNGDVIESSVPLPVDDANEILIALANSDVSLVPHVIRTDTVTTVDNATLKRFYKVYSDNVAFAEVDQPDAVEAVSEATNIIPSQVIPLQGVDMMHHDIDGGAAGDLFDINEDGDEDEEYPSIETQARLFGLNIEQKYAFTAMALALLDKIAIRGNGVSSVALSVAAQARAHLLSITGGNEQMMLLVTGSGGVGKSHVIKCFTDFAQKWNSSDMVVVTSTSGISASLVGGKTLESAIHQNSTLTIFPAKPHQAMAWATKSVLLIDEVSMLSGKKLEMLDKKLRLLKSLPDVPFGGVHVIFVGDFFQLPPFGISLLFDPAALSPSSRKVLTRGQKLFNDSINASVELVQNVRQLSDPIMAGICERLRTNEPTLRDIQLLNTRVVTHVNRPPAECTYVTFTNIDRRYFNRSIAHSFFQSVPVQGNSLDWRERGGLRLRAVHARLDGERLNPRAIKTLKRDTAQASGWKVESDLDVIVGSKYMITTNLLVEKGICNGTPVTIHDVVLKAGTQIRLEDYSEQYTDVQVHSVSAADVVCLILKHEDGPYAQDDTFTPALGVGFFPVMYVKQSVRVNQDVFINGVNVKVSVRQFPIIPSICRTIHKSQGCTLEPLCTGSLKAFGCGQRGLLYVMISRCKSLENLYMLFKLSENIRRYVRRNDVINFMNHFNTTVTNRTTDVLRNLLL